MSDLRLGVWAAFSLFVLYVGYLLAAMLSGVASGAPMDPWWKIAEVLTIAGAPIQVALFAVIHERAEPRARIFGLIAFGWMLVMAATTIAVHFIELTVARRIDVTDPALAQIFDFSQMSLLLGLELLAWHLFFGLALIFGAFAVHNRGPEASIRSGLLIGGVLCIVGLSGHVLDVPALRLIGVIGYGIVFPIVCLRIGFVYRSSLRGPSPT